MLKIGDKDVIFAASVLMLPEETATLAPPEARGLVFRLQAGKLDAPIQGGVDQNFEQAINGQDVVLSFPFLRNGLTMSAEHNVGTSAGDMGVRFAASCAGNYLLVHLQGYWSHKPA